MKIFGIDPGTAKMGYAVIEVVKTKPVLLDSSVISTPSDMEMHKRLNLLYRELYSLSKKFEPEIMVIEKLFFNTNVKTAISVGQARGIPLLVAARKKMRVYEYTALEAKLLIAGYGRAKKKEVQEAVRMYMGLDEIVKPDDANDAVAIALCFLEKEHDAFRKEN